MGSKLGKLKPAPDRSSPDLGTGRTRPPLPATSQNPAIKDDSDSSDTDSYHSGVEELDSRPAGPNSRGQQVPTVDTGSRPEQSPPARRQDTAAGGSGLQVTAYDPRMREESSLRLEGTGHRTPEREDPCSSADLQMLPRMEHLRPVIAKEYQDNSKYINTGSYQETHIYNVTPGGGAERTPGLTTFDRSNWTPLLKLYGEQDSWLRPLPWDEDLILEARDYFVEMEMEFLSPTGDRVLKKAETTELWKIFEPNQPGEDRPYAVLIRGDAGFGKSSLCTKLAYDWARGHETFSCFPCNQTLMLKYRLRDLPKGADLETELVSCLHAHRQPGTGSAEDTKATITSMGKNFLLVLDGLDEVRDGDRHQVRNILDVEHPSVFNSVSVIVTSRPTTSKTIHRLFGRHLRLTGLSKENAQTLIKRSLNKLEITDFIHLKYLVIEKERNLTPLFLQLLCYSYSHRIGITPWEQIHITCVRTIFKRSNHRFAFSYGEKVIEKAMSTLGRYFYHCESQKKYVYPVDELRDNLKEDFHFCILSGILRSIPSSITGTGDSYESIHRLFAEHLSVFYQEQTTRDLGSDAERREFFKDVMEKNSKCEESTLTVIVAHRPKEAPQILVGACPTMDANTFRWEVNHSEEGAEWTVRVPVFSSTLPRQPLLRITFRGISSLERVLERARHCIPQLSQLRSDHVIWSLIPRDFRNANFFFYGDASSAFPGSLVPPRFRPDRSAACDGSFAGTAEVRVAFIDSGVSAQVISSLLSQLHPGDGPEPEPSASLRDYFHFLVEHHFPRTGIAGRKRVLVLNRRDGRRIARASKYGRDESNFDGDFLTWEDCDEFQFYLHYLSPR